ncbi:hypothetical protein [Aquisalibacillus elongatus]|uniref:Uncharacterized protein n=1 Tax=Aquisalibacillus elongatus TaxID=485577 RepID=A0A3N5C7F7_9BACI|nr:hypothetical protein [Aquisalibacillus elongatus]RPF54285.1 hypothetical protein EDC24_1482 [Aquisalibacillus elongatus]
MSPIIVGDRRKITSNNEMIVDDSDFKDQNEVYYLPTERVVENLANHNVYVYHDLSLYAPFQKMKHYIKEETSLKGVFRMRRLLNHVDDPQFVIGADLFELESLFGKPEKIYLKSTQNHSIVSVRYVDGTMAHVDYTFQTKDYLSIEWSGLKYILEFDQHDMSPFDEHNYFESFQIDVDHLLNEAYPLERLTNYISRLDLAELGVNGS